MFDFVQILKKRGIKQKELAEKLGITPQKLHSMLKNDPTVLSLQKIAEVIGCEMADFFPPSSKSVHSPELIYPHCHRRIVLTASKK